MKALFFLLAGILALSLQGTILSRIFPLDYTPDLILLLVVYLGVGESYLRGSALAYMLGAIQGVYAGIFVGLYGMALLATFVLIRSLIGRLNTENSVLLLVVVFFATLAEGVLLILLSFLAGPGMQWLFILERMLPQAFINLGCALLILKIINLLQKKPGSRVTVPGLQRLDRRYES